MMNRGSQKYRNHENNDKFSDLPDSIILHILSFLNTKDAFQTCILSKRWYHLPKHLPTLIFNSDPFQYLDSFNNFVSQVFSLRDDSTALHTLEFTEEEDFVEPEILESLVEYAVSHNVQRLQTYITFHIQQSPSCLFSSQTLTSLHLSVHPRIQPWKILFPNSLNLPALTTLTLSYFYFGAGDDGCAEPFSTFNKLNTLTVEYCQLLDAQVLYISSTTLVNLTIHGWGYFQNYHDDRYECKFAAPSLCSFAFDGTMYRNLCQNHLCSIKHFYIDVVVDCHSSVEEESAVLLSWLQDLVNIKSLKVSSNTLQVLFSCCFFSYLFIPKFC